MVFWFCVKGEWFSAQFESLTSRYLSLYPPAFSFLSVSEDIIVYEVEYRGVQFYFAQEQDVEYFIKKYGLKKVKVYIL